MLLRPFIAAKKLHISRALVGEISRALQVGDAGSDLGLLPSLREIVPDIPERDIGNLFTSFIDARQVAGCPVLLLPSRMSHSRSSGRRIRLLFPDVDMRYRYHSYEPFPDGFWERLLIPPAQLVPLEHNLPAPHAPPVRVEHNNPRSSRTARSVITQPPPPSTSGVVFVLPTGRVLHHGDDSPHSWK